MLSLAELSQVTRLPSGDGYLLCSVGPNGTDDGGQRVSHYEATTLRKGDLFFDASWDTPDDEAIPQPVDDD